MSWAHRDAWRVISRDNFSVQENKFAQVARPETYALALTSGN